MSTIRLGKDDHLSRVDEIRITRAQGREVGIDDPPPVGRYLRIGGLTTEDLIEMASRDLPEMITFGDHHLLIPMGILLDRHRQPDGPRADLGHGYLGEHQGSGD